MIVIKRECSSSIRDDPVQKKITFGSFTVRIDDWDYRAFDLLKNELKLKPVDLMEEIILEGLAALYNVNGWQTKAGDEE